MNSSTLSNPAHSEGNSDAIRPPRGVADDALTSEMIAAATWVCRLADAQSSVEVTRLSRDYLADGDTTPRAMPVVLSWANETCIRTKRSKCGDILPPQLSVGCANHLGSTFRHARNQGAAAIRGCRADLSHCTVRDCIPA